MRRRTEGPHLEKTIIEPVRSGLEARRTAARLLSAVVVKHTPLDALTDSERGHPRYLALEERDRALARAILGAALRNRGAIKLALSRLFDRPLPVNAVALEAILHVAAAQILYLEVPDRAAVDLAVTAAWSDPRARRFAGLVNAVLRRLSREKAALPTVEARDNAPQWFVDRLERAYGREKAVAILVAQRVEPPIDLSVKGDACDWAARLGGIVTPTGSVRLASVDGPLTRLPGFAEGEWWVQDVAATLPVRLLGDVGGKTVADLCAAPGGKTAQLVLAKGRVTAFDISASRLRRLRANLARLGLDAETIEADLLAFEPEHRFGAVLLDAPCSSTGTVRRHPDVVWIKTPEDIAKLADLQTRLLEKAAAFVEPGGTLVFSNCSLDPREGEDVAGAFVAQRDDFEILPVTADDVGGLSALVTKTGFLRSTPADMPNQDIALAGMDGFFAARFRRRY